MKTHIKLIILLICCISFVFGQIEKYDYKRKLTGITDIWHKIVLPDELYSKVQNDFHDIRIYGLTEKDTLEAPYILKILTGSVKRTDITFRLINQSHNAKGYYFTFKISRDNTINLINLDFNNRNFDWRVDLQGSQNQREWYRIIEDYRILSIQNEMINYSFSTLKIPDSHYKYYRLLIKANQKPILSSAKIYEQKTIEGAYREYTIKAKNIYNSDKYKQTVIDISLHKPVSVTFLKLSVSDKFDYYRPLNIEYLSDSVKTEKGWNYNYNTLARGILSSLEENEYKFNQRITNKLKVVIQNHDNQPLNIKTVMAKGYVQELIARFNKPAEYYLVYGNKGVYKPNYDIVNFQQHIPKKLSELTIGDEEQMQKAELPFIEPLFQNPAWLWVIMIIIILVLGWFSIRMIKGK